MARQLREEADSKAQLVGEICSTGSIFASCTHHRRSSSRSSPVFVDWYLVLGVDEDEKVDAIRKRYRQLALQLHPDKNKHTKADVAFRLVSEAYACLSDKAKRKAFNLERWSNFCKECYNRAQSMNHGNTYNNHHAHKQRPCKSTGQASSYRMLTTLRQVQKRFREECEVIESCLRANQAHWKEFPLFDPYEQVLSSPGYPHSREVSEKPRNNNWHFDTNRVRDRCSRGVRCESPVYEIGMKSYPRREGQPDSSLLLGPSSVARSFHYSTGPAHHPSKT